jgi:CMP-2-keto-3-deoxyoctulosonic acid synthetase
VVYCDNAVKVVVKKQDDSFSFGRIGIGYSEESIFH